MSALPNVLRPTGIPLDEQFCVYGLRAPAGNFIGFSVAKPVSGTSAQLPWYTKVDNIMGGSVSIEWVSANLNQPWFAGSRWIPDDKTCDGMYWMGSRHRCLAPGSGDAVCVALMAVIGRF
jgi:hypothetical protein